MTPSQTPEPRYVLNVNDGIDTMHRSPTLEQCNADQIEGRQTVDAKTAMAMVLNGHAVRCQHCFMDEPEP